MGWLLECWGSEGEGMGWLFECLGSEGGEGVRASGESRGGEGGGESVRGWEGY